MYYLTNYYQLNKHAQLHQELIQNSCYRDKYCQECIGDLEKQHGKDKDRPLTGDLTFSALMEAIEDEEDR
mgnify:CR=1 FL=1